MDAYFILACVVFAISGVILDLLSAKTSFHIEQLVSATPDGKLQTREVIAFPARYHLFKVLSGFLYALAGSVFISVFVTNQLEEGQKKRKEEELQALSNAVNIDVFDSLFKRLMPPEI